MSIKSDSEIEKILMLSLKEPYIEFRTSHPEGDRQKLYRFRKRIADEMPLLSVPELIVRVRDKEWIVLEWKSKDPLVVNTERPPEKENLEIRTAPPKRPRAKQIPDWLEERLNGRRNCRELREQAVGEAREHLDTLVIACERLVDIYTEGKEDAELEKFARTANLEYVMAAFYGEEKFVTVDMIEMLRLQIADIPVDDPSRERERLELIKHRDRLLLERDKRLQTTNPL